MMKWNIPYPPLWSEVPTEMTLEISSWQLILIIEGPLLLLFSYETTYFSDVRSGCPILLFKWVRRVPLRGRRIIVQPSRGRRLRTA